MSYILDALRKLEEKGGGGETSPSLPADAGAGRRGRFPWAWPAVLAAALLLNAALAGWWMFSTGREGKGEAGAPAHRPTAPPTVDLEPAGVGSMAASLTEETAAAPFTARVPLREYPAAPQSAELPAPAATVPAEAPKQKDDAMPSLPSLAGSFAKAADPAPPEAAIPAEAVPGEGGQGLSAGDAFTESPVATEVPATPSPPVPPAPETTDPLRIHRWEELPDSLRSSVGDLQISGHIWSDDSSFRIITVNNSLKREGDAVSRDLRLIEITEKGAIFSYRGTHFRIDDR